MIVEKSDSLFHKEKRALQYIKSFAPKDGGKYIVCFSGGKDSDAIRILAEMSGVKHEIVHNLTTVDTPETVRYVKSIPGIRIERPELSMWQLIVKKKMPPTRLARYCCEELKEKKTDGIKITGVRWSESQKRKESAGFVKVIGKPQTMQKLAEETDVEHRITKQGGIVMNVDDDKSRRFVEHCYRTTTTMVNPIVDWTDDDVWEFLNYNGCKSNPLYYCGYKRIGCIGCPLGGYASQKREFARYPKYKQAYIRAFDKMVKAREDAGLTNNGVWYNGESVFKWWIGENPDQISLFDEEEFT